MAKRQSTLDVSKLNFKGERVGSAPVQMRVKQASVFIFLYVFFAIGLGVVFLYINSQLEAQKAKNQSLSAEVADKQAELERLRGPQ